MNRLNGIGLTICAVLVLLGGTLSTGLRAQDKTAAEPIGFVEIDGIGRYDIYPVAEGMTRTEAAGLIYEGKTPTAFWHKYGDTPGGKIYIFALPVTGDVTESSILVEFYLSEDRTALDTIHSRGIHLNPPISGDYPWSQQYGTDVAVEELAMDGDGPMTLKLRFEGTATRTYSSGSPPKSEVPMKGVLEVEGLPFRP